MEHYNFKIWFGAIFWTAFLLMFYKYCKAPKKGFKLRYFINDNIYDLILNVLISVILLRTGDTFLHWVYDILNKKLFSKFDIVLDADSLDVVMAIAIITLPISYLIHKFLRKPVINSIEKEMHIHNKNCMH